MRHSFSRRSFIDRGLSCVLFVCTVLSLVPLVVLLFYVLSRGLDRFDVSAFTQLPPPPLVPGGGFANALVGTIAMVSLASGLSIPIGVLGAVYVAEFGQRGTWLISLAANVLSSVPSIIVGVFVYGLIVLPTTVLSQGRYSFSAVAGGIALGIVMIPMIFRNTLESFKQVEPETRWGAMALGATPSQTVLGVVIPQVMGSISLGILLAMARAAGETAPLIFTALSNQFWPRGIFEPTPSLSVLIYEFSRSPFANQQQLAWTTALVLSGLVGAVSLLAKTIPSR